MKKKILSTILALSLALCGLNVNLEALAKREKLKNEINSNSKILYLTEKFNDNYLKEKGFQKNIISKSKKHLTYDEVSECDGMWVDLDTVDLKDSKIIDKIIKMFNDNKKLLFKKKNFQVEEVINALNINPDQYSINDLYTSAYSDPKLKVYGLMVKKDYMENGYAPTVLRVSIENDDLVNTGLYNSTLSDYVSNKIEPETSLVSVNIASAAALEWAPVSVAYTFYDTFGLWQGVDSSGRDIIYPGATVEGNILLQKHPSNPMAGAHWLIGSSEVKITPMSINGVKNTYKDFSIYQDFGPNGKIYSYGPQDAYNKKDFSISLGYNTAYATFNFSTANSLSVAKTAGGYNAGNLQIKYTSSGQTTFSNMVKQAAEFTVPTSSSRIWGYTGMHYWVDIYKQVPKIFTVEYQKIGTCDAGYYTGGYIN
ncbi:MAG TPA: hypothetical protein VIO64_14155 [Pseudobacteroides sp.]|uniref:hypothetical protein n=1 Tax=Pseudobacteroides sp. TaxID=1968840 RepID=UPI002F91EC6A